MTEYSPVNRRPIANVFRKTAQGMTRVCVRAGISPNAVSLFSIVAASAAAVCFWQASNVPLLLWIAPAFCYVRLYCNMLDGMVALEGGTASPRGEIFNDFPDRVSDVLIFVGVAFCGLVTPSLGLLGAVAAVFVAYTGVLGQAVGVQREFSGIMSKQWRMMALHAGAWVQAGALAAKWTPNLPLGMTIFDAALIGILLGCLQTIFVRLRRIVAAIDRKAASEPR